MEDLQQYLRSKLDAFNKTYNVQQYLNSYTDKDLKHQWKYDRERVKGRWQDIKSISDVERCIVGFAATVERYQNIKGIFSDAYDMDLSLYEAVLAIQKMAQCYEFDNFDFHTFNKTDIDNMFVTLYKWLEEMKNVNMRRLMQD